MQISFHRNTITFSHLYCLTYWNLLVCVHRYAYTCKLHTWAVMYIAHLCINSVSNTICSPIQWSNRSAFAILPTSTAWTITSTPVCPLLPHTVNCSINMVILWENWQNNMYVGEAKTLVNIKETKLLRMIKEVVIEIDEQKHLYDDGWCVWLWPLMLSDVLVFCDKIFFNPINLMVQTST